MFDKKQALNPSAQLGHRLRRTDEPVPVFDDVLRRAADLRYHLGSLFGGDHLDGIPRANRQLVRVRLFARDMHANLAANAGLDVDLAPLVRAEPNAAIKRLERDAVDRTNFQARLAAGAIVGIDDRQFLGNLFASAFFCHEILAVGSSRAATQHTDSSTRTYGINDHLSH